MLRRGTRHRRCYLVIPTVASPGIDAFVDEGLRWAVVAVTHSLSAISYIPLKLPWRPRCTHACPVRASLAGVTHASCVTGV